jgi:hypothetical protein
MRCRSGVIAVLLDQRGHMPASIKVRRLPLGPLGEDHHREYEGTSHLPATVSKHQD